MSQAPVMNSYKASFILDMRGYEEPLATLIEKIKSTLESIGAQVGEVKDLGVKDFAQVTDRRFPQANYLQVRFQGAPNSSVALREKFRLDRTVARILVEKA